MNRDESLLRPVALPPRLWTCGSIHAIHPSEPDGGTWIGGNERGIALALLNWYSKPPPPGSGFPGRGTLIPSLLHSRSILEATSAIATQPLAKMKPFRLVAFSNSEQSILEWNWCGRSLTTQAHPWQTLHWFSSGFDEPRANAIRAETCRKLAATMDDGFQELHRSHDPEQGPFSICMHRQDARTVSCTRMEWTTAGWEMEYHDGPPCLGFSLHKLNLQPGGYPSPTATDLK